jgi:iron complex outermembrane receptor protein
MTGVMSAALVHLLLMQLVAFAPPAQQAQSPPTFVAPPIIVTAQKEPADVQRLPVSVTAVTAEAMARTGIDSVAEAAVLSPNTRVVELSARKFSNPLVRGIGSSPQNPGVTTYIDGVPQLNSNSSGVELLDVERIEFVRGPQGALFGRNTLGGLVSIASARPSMTSWTGTIATPLGSHDARAIRASVSGPVSGSLAVSASYGHDQREGFTTNDLTGHPVDSRSGAAAKAQLMWVPSAQWETRLILFGERARDGDYALNDLGEVRRNPFHVMRDVEGWTDRDLWSGTLLVRREGKRLAFSSATGYVSWQTRDFTDLDYSPMPLLTRDNAERDRQLTPELRLASAAGAPVRLSDGVALAWQSGLALFAQRYAQDAVNAFAPHVLSPWLPVSVDQHSPRSDLDDDGASAYGQGTLTFGESFDVVLGARVDRERKGARLDTYYVPAVAPAAVVVVDAWVRNAFDTRYVPVAFAYGGLAPSGFLGEPGHPRTFGVSVGVGF